MDEQPGSRRAVGGESVVTDTVAGEQAIFGFQPPEEAVSAEDDPDAPPSRPGVLSDGLGQPQGPYDHWLYHEDWL